MYNKNKKFSLIELLLVMVISAIMLGIVIPTFHKITKGVNVEAAARQLGAQLKAVREYAITNREYVALIMESKNAVDTTSNLGDHKLVSYRPCIINSSNVFQEWVPGERWEFLPDGAEIKNITGISEEVTKVTDDKISITNVSVKPVVIFSPTGKCEGISGANAQVKVGETVGSDNETQNHINITIAAYTGRVSYGDQ